MSESSDFQALPDGLPLWHTPSLASIPVDAFSHTIYLILLSNPCRHLRMSTYRHLMGYGSWVHGCKRRTQICR